MSADGRPLSPHLTIYRWPITMVLSILHRATGVALSVGLLAWVVWLNAVAFDAPSYASVSEFLAGWVGQFTLFGWCFCFFFHLSNGIRHLIWDSGRLLSREQADKSAWFVLGSAVVLTAGYWFLMQGGAG